MAGEDGGFTAMLCNVGTYAVQDVHLQLQHAECENCVHTKRTGSQSGSNSSIVDISFGKECLF